MTVEPIFDDQGRRLGTVETHSNGDKVGRDAQNRLAGAFNAAAGVTRDAQGRLVSRGDTVASLVRAAGK